ncbi:MAG: DUF411 domain-containing protein [Rhodocyclaceae bacterium]
MITSSRITRLAVAVALGLAATATVLAKDADIKVFKSPYCGCCEKWIAHLREHGMKVSVVDVQDTAAARRDARVPEALASCHTATIDGYAIEGHVPAQDIARLLKSRPKAIGLAVPGMPASAPGMDMKPPVPYEVLLVQADGSTRVFARH